eukprot:TRINITY_DN8334_c0_g2_i1.p1 TRINITY_DN8334_c0_g2~~TRINITY_DN8334_c0_g2_i1.p1  ORF type:complete len:633 (+),score=97.65 TRINITY_DN8334_c0_g2_i1:274-1899(+)
MWWSPAGSKLAYLQFNQTEVPVATIQYYSTSPYAENIALHYPKAGFPNPITKLMVYRSDSGETVAINVLGEYVTGVAWATEDLIVVRVLNRLQNEKTFYACDSGSGECSSLGSFNSTTWITGNIPLTLITDQLDQQYIVDLLDNNGYNHLALITVNTTFEDRLTPELPLFLTEGDWEVTDFVGYSSVSQLFYFVSTEVSPLERHIYSVDINGSTKTKLTTNSGWYEATMSTTGSWMTIFFNGNVSTVPSTYLKSTKSGVEIVIDNNSALNTTLDSLSLPQPQFFNFTSNNSTLNGLMLLPPKFQTYKEYPVILQVYGSPGSQIATNSFSLGLNTYLASQGCIVAMVDGHGTGGRGNAFQTQVYKQLGVYEVQEQMDAIAYLQSLKFVDPKYIAMWGWGYGGFVTALAMATPVKAVNSTSVNFIAGASVAPITDWIFYDSVFTERYMQMPQNNQQGYNVASVLNKEMNVERDFLLVHGTADPLIHLQNSVVLSRMLVSRKFGFSEQLYTNADDSFAGSDVLEQMYSKLSKFLMSQLRITTQP